MISLSLSKHIVETIKLISMSEENTGPTRPPIKKLYEKTLTEYMQSALNPKVLQDADYSLKRSCLSFKHEEAVYRAILSGKQIPPHVLDSYLVNPKFIRPIMKYCKDRGIKL